MRYPSGSLLAISEALQVVDGTVTFIDYRYHCQTQKTDLIFRYDSAKHFPNLPSFPHHKHLPDRVIATEKPSIQQVLREADGIAQRNDA